MGNRQGGQEQDYGQDYGHEEDEVEELVEPQANQSQGIIKPVMSEQLKEKITKEASQIVVKYGEPQTSLLGSGKGASDSKTDDSVSDSSKSEKQQSFRLLKFDSFLSMYSLITRMAKAEEPQEPKPATGEDRKSLREQAKDAYKSQDWELYRLLVLQQLSLEKDAHDAITSLVLAICKVDVNIFNLSHQKFQLNRLCEEQISGTLAGINKVQERAERNKQRQLWLMTGTAKQPSKELVMETLEAIEEQKKQTLSELSNPFKAAREKYETVIDLEVAKAKIRHFIEVDKSFESERLFWAACHEYGLMKTQEELDDPDRERLTRDAEVIKLNAR